MVIDFSTAKIKEQPPLVLRNLDGTAIQVLGCASGLKAEISYNEVSSITFSVPRYVDGELTPGYDLIIGTRIVDLIGWGQFVLSDPETVNDGVNEIKSCKAFSLEYEFSKRKITLPEGTYCFWNPATPDETVVGIILEYMPSWSVGTIDSELVGKYRTFSVSGTSIYDFIKSTLQKSFSCIFTFDTYQRKIHVKHTDTDAEQSAVYLSLDNLAQELKIQEDSEHIVTVLDVNGADGVDIRNVNPIGSNKIYNLDYYMNTSHFSQALINKWTAWKTTVSTQQPVFFRLSMERMLKIAEIESAQAALTDQKNIELANLENIRSVKIEMLGKLGLSDFCIGLTDFDSGEEPSGGGYTRQKFTDWIISEGDIYAYNGTAITFPTATSDWFPASHGVPPRINAAFFIDRVEQIPFLTSFYTRRTVTSGDTVVLAVDDVRAAFNNIVAPDIETKENITSAFHLMADLYTLKGQIQAVNTQIAWKEAEILSLEAESEDIRGQMVSIVNQCSFGQFFTDAEMLVLNRYFVDDSIAESSFVIPQAISYVNTGESSEVASISVSITGAEIEAIPISQGRYIYKVSGGSITAGSLLSADIISLILDGDGPGQSITFTGYFGVGSIGVQNFASGSFTCKGDLDDLTHGDDWISVDILNARMFFTENYSTYAQYYIEMELYEYGADVLRKLAYPSYTFDVSSANFFALDDFYAFIQAIGLGKRIYLNDDHGNILNPILVSVSLDFEDLSSLSLQFGSTYNLSDSSFQLVDLLEQSVSMGRTVDTGRFNYNTFIDSGAATSVKQFMDSALDVSKNAIVSSNGQDVSWDSSGIHARKTVAGGGYDPREIAIINNSIVFTDDGWSSVKMAVGQFNDPNFGEQWGIVAPSIVGTLLAGRNLLIESAKKDGGIAVFRVDGDGAVLHNAQFDIISGGNHILLDPTVGIAIGSYPVVDGNGDIDTDNAKFWVDSNGNVHVKGIVQADDFLDRNGNSMLNASDQITSGYLDLKGLIVKDSSNNTTFEVTNSGKVRIVGTIDDTPLSWSHNGNTASIGFANGNAGDTTTDLIQINSNVGILIEAGSNIRIHATNKLWLQNRPRNINVLVPNSPPDGNYHYVSLYDYIVGVINGTYTS